MTNLMSYKIRIAYLTDAARCAYVVHTACSNVGWGYIKKGRLAFLPLRPVDDVPLRRRARRRARVHTSTHPVQLSLTRDTIFVDHVYIYMHRRHWHHTTLHWTANCIWQYTRISARSAKCPRGWTPFANSEEESRRGTFFTFIKFSIIINLNCLLVKKALHTLFRF